MKNLETMGQTVQKYQQYRKIGTKMSTKMIRFIMDLDGKIAMDAAKTLGIVEDNVIIFESKNDTHILMDFMLLEFQRNQKTAIEIYKKQIGGQDEIENDILNAFGASYTSLFQISSILADQKTLILTDLLNQRDNVPLMDISFSAMATSGMLVFTRIVPCSDFNMTSGVSFVFHEDKKKHLLQCFKKQAKKMRLFRDSVKRYLIFYKLHKSEGIEVAFI